MTKMSSPCIRLRTSNMIILGIDPGTATTGYAFIEKNQRGDLLVLDFGVISTNKKNTPSKRLLDLHSDLAELIRNFHPEVAGVEKLYFEKNVTTAMGVSQARGVALLALEESGVGLSEFTPLQVKSTICGYGKADKKQVQYMVQKTFGLKTIPKPDDAADALAIALCAAMNVK
jgi:crossover junction endodeoxyribonuclease RuvC